MAVPKKRTAKSKRNMRRSHHGLSRMHLSACPRCHQPLPPHTVCANCGTYKGREVIDVMAKLEKKAKREKKKELEQQEADHEH
jgi:large subunit ribosomal protein L32